jgi:DNA-binding MarR family transcriptional regulator
MGRKAVQEKSVLQWPVCALASTRRAARLLTQLYDSHLAVYGIEAGQFALLMMLDAIADRGQAELARMLGMDKTTLSRNLKVLKQRGWVESEVGTDARRRELKLTAEGRAILESSRPGWRRAQDSFKRALGEPDWVAMMDTMETVARAAIKAGEKNGSAKT